MQCQAIQLLMNDLKCQRDLLRGWEPGYPEETPPVRYDDKQAHMLPERGLNHNDSRTALFNYIFLFPNELNMHNIHTIFLFFLIIIYQLYYSVQLTATLQQYKKNNNHSHVLTLSVELHSQYLYSNRQKNAFCLLTLNFFSIKKHEPLFKMIF